MARVSTEAKNRYATKVQEFQADIEEIQSRETQVLADIDKNPAEASVRRLSLAHDSLNLVSYYLLMNDLSIALLGVKNDAHLNNARKGCYRGIIYLEEVVSAMIDAPFGDYEERLASIRSVDEAKRYFLNRKLGFTVESVIAAFGENTKWKWSFVELEGLFATVTKNMLDLKNVLRGLDPRVEGYEMRVAHLNLAKRLMQKSADGYRQKYELSTSRIDDFKLAISYLSGLRRLHIVLGDSDESDALRKKIEIWTTKMETDLKKVDQARKAKRQGAPGA